MYAREERKRSLGCVLNADAEEAARVLVSPTTTYIERKTACNGGGQLQEVVLYAQMDELQYEEYNFKGTRFPLALSAFTWGGQIGRDG